MSCTGRKAALLNCLEETQDVTRYPKLQLTSEDRGAIEEMINNSDDDLTHTRFSDFQSFKFSIQSAVESRENQMVATLVAIELWERILKKIPSTPPGIPLEAGDKGFVKFVQSVRQMPYTKHVKYLSQCQIWGAGNLPDGRLYVRPVYRKLYKVLRDEPASTLFTIEGTPGIGKTTMIPYMIWRLLRETPPPENIFFCPQQENKHFLRIARTGAITRVTKVELKNQLHPGDYVLIDGEVGSSMGSVSGYAIRLERVKMVAFISPRKRNRQCFGNERLKRKLMPPWGIQELLDCREHVYKTIPREDVLNRFKQAGGVARYVFRDGDWTLIKSELSKLDLSTILHYTGEIRESTSTDDGRFRVLHAWPDAAHSCPFQFEAGIIRFASTAVQNYVLTKWDQQQWLEILEELWQNTGIEIQGYRNLFETACHKLLPQTEPHSKPLRLKYQALEKHPGGWTRSGKKAKLRLLKAEMVDFGGCTAIDRLVEKSRNMADFEGVYADPLEGRYPSVDAVIIPKDLTQAPILLQYTVGEDRLLDMYGVLGVWESLSGHFSKLPVFYFVVPDHRLDTFQPKLPKYSHGIKQAAVKDLFKKMQFYIVSLCHGKVALIHGCPSSMLHLFCPADKLKKRLIDGTAGNGGTPSSTRR
eukprot:gb/GECG01005505.1/.p1 GENE.gb/GECG01005505.1/~~gb/GECG01005505.1/.p1  ORF type:complete len:643 (+),score=66.22 gb/GECG01005505.1/:1-1929(+)